MNEPNSRDFARDAEASRIRLSEKLGDFQDGVSPGRLLDEVLSYGKNGGALFLKALNNAARENRSRPCSSARAVPCSYQKRPA
jgi:hypothetical protein